MQIKEEALTEWAKWIRKFMKENSLIVAVVAEKSGLPEQTINRWRRANYKPRMFQSSLMIRAFHLLTKIDEGEIYKQSSKAILKDG